MSTHLKCIVNALSTHSKCITTLFSLSPVFPNRVTFVKTWSYSTSCRVFTISKISLFAWACKFTVYVGCDEDLFSRASWLSFLFLLKSWFVIKDGKLLPCRREHFFLMERHLWMKIWISRDSRTFFFLFLRDEFARISKMFVLFWTPVVRFWKDMLHMHRLKMVF